MSEVGLEAVEKDIDARILKLEQRVASNRLVTTFLREVLGEIDDRRLKRSVLQDDVKSSNKDFDHKPTVQATLQPDRKINVFDDLESVLKMAREARAHSAGPSVTTERAMSNAHLNTSSGVLGAGDNTIKSIARDGRQSKVLSRNVTNVSGGVNFKSKPSTVGTQKHSKVNDIKSRRSDSYSKTHHLTASDNENSKAAETEGSADLKTSSLNELSDLSVGNASSIEEECSSLRKLETLNIILDSFFRNRYLLKSKYNSLYGDLIVAQTSLLSTMSLKDRNRISLPNCYLYSLLQETSLTDENLSKQQEQSDSKLVQQDVTLKQAMIVGSIFEKYEKILKPRMSRLKFEHLDIEDKKDILRLWYQLRSMYNIYSQRDEENSKSLHIQLPINRKQKLSVSSSRSGLNELIECTPKAVPYLVDPSAKGFYQANRKWLKSTLVHVDRYMSSFNSRVEYTCETAIAKGSLKSNISRLKFCCQRQAELTLNSANKYHSNELRQEWIESLKMFRDVYCCLVKSAESYQGCCYLEKL